MPWFKNGAYAKMQKNVGLSQIFIIPKTIPPFLKIKILFFTQPACNN